MWEENGKYYYSTAPYRQYGKEITFEEYAALILEGAEKAENPWIWSTASSAITYIDNTVYTSTAITNSYTPIWDDTSGA